MKTSIKQLEKNKAKKAELLAQIQTLSQSNKDLKQDVLHEKFASIMTRSSDKIKISGLPSSFERKLDLEDQKTYIAYNNLCQKVSELFCDFQNYYWSPNHNRLIGHIEEIAVTDNWLKQYIVTANFKKSDLELLLYIENFEEQNS